MEEAADLLSIDDETAELLDELMGWHADPDDEHYNECDTDPCNWCERAKIVVAAIRGEQA